MTKIGKGITKFQEIAGKNKLIGFLWRWASKSWAEGAADYAHFFEGPNRNPKGVWNVVEKPILENNNVNIIYH